MTPVQPLRVLIAALGGQGGGVLAEWLVAAATEAGFFAQGTSIPGVAQRTGATTYYVEIFPIPRAELAGRTPVLGLYPVPGAVDLVVASELLEAGRVLQAGMVSAGRTVLVTSTSRTLTTAEKMALGDGRFSSDRLLEVARAHSRALAAFDMDATAREAGTVVSAVMLGALAGTGVLPMAAPVYEAVIRARGVGVAGSLRGFAAGLAACANAVGTVVASTATASAATASTATTRTAPASIAMRGTATPSTLSATDVAAPAAAASSVVDPVRGQRIPVAATATCGSTAADPGASFPPEVAAMVALGAARLAEYQDEAYAALYRERVARVLAAEVACDPRAGHGRALTREFARFLALWMAYDDLVRVAALKVRASRFARVRSEVAAAPGDVVRIVDHFRPGVPELAGLLPVALAGRLRRWDARRQARGKGPLSLPLHLRSDGVLGLLSLRLLASLAHLRRRGARYAEEQAGIDRWLAAVLAGAGEDWALAYELALCGRLIKGYGETNERGKRNLSHIIGHLAAGPEAPAARANAIREAREAALADEAGKALDAALVRHGAPARPVVAQPIRFVKRPPASPATSHHA